MCVCAHDDESLARLQASSLTINRTIICVTLRTRKRSGTTPKRPDTRDLAGIFNSSLRRTGTQLFLTSWLLVRAWGRARARGRTRELHCNSHTLSLRKLPDSRRCCAFVSLSVFFPSFSSFPSIKLFLSRFQQYMFFFALVLFENNYNDHEKRALNCWGSILYRDGAVFSFG